MYFLLSTTPKALVLLEHMVEVREHLSPNSKVFIYIYIIAHPSCLSVCESTVDFLLCLSVYLSRPSQSLSFALLLLLKHVDLSYLIPFLHVLSLLSPILDPCFISLFPFSLLSAPLIMVIARLENSYESPLSLCLFLFFPPSCSLSLSFLSPFPLLPFFLSLNLF